MLAALLLIAQQPRTVTFTHPCASAAVVLEALGKEMGVTVRPSGTVAQDYFAIKLTGVSIEEAMRVIAATLDAEWLQKETVLYLDRGPKQQLKAKLEEDEGIRKSVKEFIDKNPEREIDKEAVKKALIDFSDPKRSQALVQEAGRTLQAYSPETRLGARVVRALGEDSFVRAQEGRPVRYFLSSDGTGDMPAAIKGAIQKYEADMELFSVISQAVGSSTPFGGLQSAGYQTDYALTVTRSSGYVRVILLRRMSMNGEMNGAFNSQIATFSGRANNGLPGRKPSIPTLTGALELSPLALSVTKVVNNDSASTDSDRSASIGVAKDLLANELHTLYGSAPLLQMSQQAGRDFVAVLPDTIVMSPFWTKGMDLNTAWNQWLRGMAIVEDQKTKIVQIRATDPFWGEGGRFDRAAVSRFVSNYERSGRATLDSVAAFAYQMENAAEFGFNWRLAAAFVPVGKDARDFVALKTYGSLNPIQKRYAQNGGCVLPLRSLSGSVRELIEEQITSQGATFSGQPPGANWNPNGRSYQGNTSYGPLSISGRVPENCEVKIVVYRNSLLRPAPNSKSPGTNQVQTIEQFADFSRLPPGEVGADFKLAAVANVDRLQVEVFAPGVGYTHHVAQVDDTTAATKYVPLAELPEPWRSQVAAAINRRGG